MWPQQLLQKSVKDVIVQRTFVHSINGVRSIVGRNVKNIECVMASSKCKTDAVTWPRINVKLMSFNVSTLHKNRSKRIHGN